MKYKLVIFDMDGTILNSLDDLCDATNYTLEQMNCPRRSIDEVRSFVGNGIPMLIKRAMPENSSSEELQRAYEIFMPYYKVHCLDKTRAYDGVVQLIQKLRDNGIKTAVASNKRDEAVQMICTDYFEGLFDVAVGDKEGVAKKPDSAMVDYILREVGVDRSEAIYIGDSDVDLATALNSKLDYIIVTWGFRDEKFLKEQGANQFAHDTDELLSKIV